MFARLLDTVNQEVTHMIFRIRVGTTDRPTMPRGIAQHETQTTIASTSPSPAPVSNQSIGALAAALAKSSNKRGQSDGRTPTLIEKKSDQVKIGRNDPCPCGSGKKWKKCHINMDPQGAQEQEAYSLYTNNPEEWERRFGKK
jgi:preprotein translocase subunit SecA